MPPPRLLGHGRTYICGLADFFFFQKGFQGLKAVRKLHYNSLITGSFLETNEPKRHRYGIFMKSLLRFEKRFFIGYSVYQHPQIKSWLNFCSHPHDPNNLQCFFLVVQSLPEESLFGEHGTLEWEVSGG